MALTKVHNRMIAGAPVNVFDFGAVGDGTTDDTTALTNAFNAASGKVLDGNNQTYKITGKISTTSENIVVQNMTINTSATSGVFTDGFIEFAGTLGSAQALTSNTSALSDTVVVSSTSSFSADTYAYMGSNLDFETSQSVKLGQIVKIKSVDSATQLTLYEEVLYAFNTSDTSTISPLTTKSNITFRNVHFVGADDTSNNQTALNLKNCDNVVVDNCSFEYYSYTSVKLDRCINSVITNTSSKFARKSGLSYGFVVHNGCYSVTIDNCYGEDHRHMVSVGDNEGINLFVRVANCHIASARDAGIDSHSACDYMIIEGNTVEGIDDGTDGIIFQGVSCTITNNIVVGNFSEGIRVQSLPNIGDGVVIVSGNSVNNIGTSATDSGIFIDFSGGGVLINSCNVSNNSFEGDMNYHIYVYNSTGSENMQNIVISGNASSDNATSTGMYIRTASGGGLYNISITGNIVRGSGSNGIYLQGAASNEIRRVAISGNVITGFTNGVRSTNVQDLMLSGNMNTCTKKALVATSSGVTLDQSQGVPETITNSTYVVDDDSAYLIANRNSTITLTMPSASAYAGRELSIKTIQASTVVSAGSNIVPMTTAAAGTAILPATDGAWALLKSDGTNWIIMQSS